MGRYKMYNVIKNAINQPSCNFIKLRKPCLFQNRSLFTNTMNLEKWDLMSAVSLERKPVLARELNDVEKNMMTMLSKMEFENSSKSEHELQLLTETIKMEQLKKGGTVDLDALPELSAQDFEDASVKQLESFTFSDRVTEADKSNDTRSTHRCLDRSLLLLVKEKIGTQFTWVLPQGIRQDGETMRDTAERVLKEKCGKDLQADFFGNAPVGFYKYKYPKKVKSSGSDAAVGVKIFFFKAQLKAGNVNTQLQDFHWATRNELNNLPKDYLKSVSLFLIDEDN